MITSNRIDFRYLKASNSLETPQLLAEIRQTNGMMKNPVSPVIIGIRTPNNTNHRKILTISTSDRIKNAEPTDGKRNNTGTNTARAGITVSGVSRIKLITATDISKARLSYEMIKKSEIKVAGNRENISDANLNKAASYVAAEGGFR